MRAFVSDRGRFLLEEVREVGTPSMTRDDSRGAVAAWDKAFAFMKDTDNPVLGGGRGGGSDAGRRGDGGGGGRKAAFSIGAERASGAGRAGKGEGGGDPADPLRSDGFLKGYFG